MVLELPAQDPYPLAPGQYHTDPFHLHSLFAFLSDSSDSSFYFVKSWNEAFALHGSARLSDINPAYLAALVFSQCTASVSPYKRIIRLPRSSIVSISSDYSFSSVPFDCFSLSAASLTELSYPSYFRSTLLHVLSKALDGYEGHIGVELSSGLDSNSIAGALVRGLSLESSRLFSWSHTSFGEGCLLRESLSFLNLPCSNSFLCSSLYDIDSFLFLNEFSLASLGFPHQVGLNPSSLSFFASKYCEIIFSGFGGDQGVSINGDTVAFDFSLNLRFKDLYSWCDGFLPAFKRFSGCLFYSSFPSFARKKVSSRWPHLSSRSLLSCCLTPYGAQLLAPFYQKQHPWEIDEYLPTHLSLRRRLLADWVAVRVEEENRLSRAMGLTVVHPLLHPHLLSPLTKLDPSCFSSRHQAGRSVARSAFSSFLPNYLKSDIGKSRLAIDEYESYLQALVPELLHSIQAIYLLLANPHPFSERLWDISLLRDLCEGCIHYCRSYCELEHVYTELQRFYSIDAWFASLDS